MAKQLTFNLRLNIDGKEVITQCSVSVKEFASQLDSARTKAKKTGDAFSHWTQQAMGFQALASSLQQLSGVLNSVTDESRSFAGAMKVANTMAGKNAEGFAKMKDEVAELAKRVPLAREELANGLYQVISNGVPEDNWLSYLEASSRSAVGGVANLGEVVKVTSTIIKNYALDWADAQSVQDKIQLTAKNGVTSFEQLAAALPSVTGQAAQLGVLM